MLDVYSFLRIVYVLDVLRILYNRVVEIVISSKLQKKVFNKYRTAAKSLTIHVIHILHQTVLMYISPIFEIVLLAVLNYDL